MMFPKVIKVTHIYLKKKKKIYCEIKSDRETQKRESSICWFIPHVDSVARAGTRAKTETRNSVSSRGSSTSAITYCLPRDLNS